MHHVVAATNRVIVIPIVAGLSISASDLVQVNSIRIQLIDYPVCYPRHFFLPVFCWWAHFNLKRKPIGVCIKLIVCVQSWYISISELKIFLSHINGWWLWNELSEFIRHRLHVPSPARFDGTWASQAVVPITCDGIHDFSIHVRDYSYS